MFDFDLDHLHPEDAAAVQRIAERTYYCGDCMIVDYTMRIGRYLCAVSHDLPCWHWSWQALHLCDNRACINPCHIVPGTPAQNADKVRRGHSTQGERSSSARLTEDDVIMIRQSTEPCTALAERLGVSARAVQHAASGETWRHLNGVAVPRASMRGASE